MSIERLLAMEAEGATFDANPELDVYVVAFGTMQNAGVKLLSTLRVAGIVLIWITDRKLKAQMKSADRLTARAVVVIGDDEG